MAEIRSLPLFTDGDSQSYYQFEGNSNDQIASNNGTDSNVTYSSANGKFGEGAGFAGTGYIEFSNTLRRANNTTNSIAFWFKTTEVAQKMMYGEGSTSNNNPLYNVDINVGASGRVRFSIRIQSGAGAEISGSGSGFNDDEWHSCVVTKNGSNFELFVDDISQGTLSSSLIPETNRVGIGALLRATEAIHFIGELDDFLFFDAVLTAEEITAIFEQNATINYLQRPRRSRTPGNLTGI